MVTQLSENGKVILARVGSCSLCNQAMIPLGPTEHTRSFVYARLFMYLWCQGKMTTIIITIFI